MFSGKGGYVNKLLARTDIKPAPVDLSWTWPKKTMASTLSKVSLACIGTGYALRHAQSETGRRQSPPTSRCFHPPSSRCRLHQRIKHVRGFSIILRIMPTHQNQWGFVRHVLPPSNYPANVEHRPPSRSPQGQKLFVLPNNCQNGQNTNMRQLCPHAMPKLTSLFFYIFLETASHARQRASFRPGLLNLAVLLCWFHSLGCSASDWFAAIWRYLKHVKLPCVAYCNLVDSCWFNFVTISSDIIVNQGLS